MNSSNKYQTNKCETSLSTPWNQNQMLAIQEIPRKIWTNWVQRRADSSRTCRMQPWGAVWVSMLGIRKSAVGSPDLGSERRCRIIMTEAVQVRHHLHIRKSGNWDSSVQWPPSTAVYLWTGHRQDSLVLSPCPCLAAQVRQCWGCLSPLDGTLPSRDAWEAHNSQGHQGTNLAHIDKLLWCLSQPSTVSVVCDQEHPNVKFGSRNKRVQVSNPNEEGGLSPALVVRLGNSSTSVWHSVQGISRAHPSLHSHLNFTSSKGADLWPSGNQPEPQSSGTPEPQASREIGTVFSCGSSEWLTQPNPEPLPFLSFQFHRITKHFLFKLV